MQLLVKVYEEPNSHQQFTTNFLVAVHFAAFS